MSSFYLQLKPIRTPQAARSTPANHLHSQNTKFLRGAIRTNTDTLKASETSVVCTVCVQRLCKSVLEERAALRAVVAPFLS